MPLNETHKFKFEKKDQNRAKLHFWVDLCRNGEIIGPNFFNRNVKGETYGKRLKKIAFTCVVRVYNRYGLVFDGLW